jgi:uncharacterized Tic20 family protein
MSVFLISFFGSILAAFLASWIRRNKKPDPIPANSNEIVEFPRSRTIIFASVCVLIAWVCMLVFLISVFLPTLGIESNLILVISLISLLVMAILYLLTSFQLKCSHCQKRVFFQISENPPFSVKYKGLTGWSSIVLQVLLMNSFTCMHCGKKYSIKSNA